MAVVGIVPAAGSGERLGADGPKAFVVCAGKPLVEWSLEVLSEVCEQESLTLSECARRAHLAPSTALRLLRTLEQAGFVSRSDEGNFGAGPRLIQFVIFDDELDLVDLATQADHYIAADIRVAGHAGENALEKFVRITGLQSAAAFVGKGNDTVNIRKFALELRTFEAVRNVMRYRRRAIDVYSVTLPRTLVRSEEKKFVAANGSAQIKAKLILLEDGPGLASFIPKERVGVQRVVTEKLPKSAVKIV